MAFLGSLTKQPGETLPIDVDYTDALAGRSGTIAAPTVDAEAGITVDSVTMISATVARIYFSGGTDLEVYAVTVTATLTIGGSDEIVEDELSVIVREAAAPSLIGPWIQSPVAFTQAMPDVMPLVPNCPEPLVIQHLRHSAIAFFERTLAWKYETDEILSVADQYDYTIPIPQQTAIVKLLGYSLDGKEIVDGVVSPDYGRQLASSETSKDAVWTLDRATVRVYPTPEADDASIKLWLALKPSRDATQIPGEMFEQHHKAIVDGALASLLAMIGSPWANPALAQAMAVAFEREVSSVGASTSRGHARSRSRVRGIWF